MEIEYLRYFNNVPKLVDATLSIIEAAGSKGIDEWNIDWNVGLQVNAPEPYLEDLINDKWVVGQLTKARARLKAQGLIGYNSKSDVWYPKRKKAYEPSAQEKQFIERRVGTGWRRIFSETEAIQWLVDNYSPDEFEHFCASILTQHCNAPAKITQKRRFSNADDGFDAIGTIVVEGVSEKFAVQAKKYALDRQVSKDEFQKFIGALIEHDMNHGLMITTRTFSDRTIAAVEKMKAKDIWVELIDQSRLAAIMLEKSDSPHGFGLYETDIKGLYLHEGILKLAGQAGA